MPTSSGSLGSTADDDASDNAEITYTAMDPGVPIFWLNGPVITDVYEDFQDDTWSHEDEPRTADGNATSARTVWTGSTFTFTEAVISGNSAAFGTASVSAGELDHAAHTPDQGATYDPTTNSFPFYALSGIFVVEPNTPAMATVEIDGKPRVGETLTAALSDITDPEGLTNIEISYQWTRFDGTDTTDIDGATSETYVLTDADAEHEINVKITFEDDYHNLEGPFTATATERVVPTEVLVRNTYDKTITDTSMGTTNTGHAQSFTTGTAQHGFKVDSIGIHFSNIAVPSGAGAELTAKIMKDDSGTPGDALCTLSDPATFTSSGIQTFAAPTSGARCTVLSANTDYWIFVERANTTTDAISTGITLADDEDAGSEDNWSIRDSGHVYKPASALNWQHIDGQSSLIIEVKGTEAVPNVSATGVPTISGTPNEGSTLTADTSAIMDNNGLPASFSYQWVHVTGTVQTDIDGATSSTYSLTADDLDKTIFVKVSFIDQDGHPEGPLASPDSGVVTAPDLLVKNTLERLTGISLDTNYPALAQAFTTGSSIAGYELHAIGFRLETVDDPTSAGNDLQTTLYEVASSGEPGAVLCILADPPTFRAERHQPLHAVLIQRLPRTGAANILLCGVAPGRSHRFQHHTGTIQPQPRPRRRIRRQLGHRRHRLLLERQRLGRVDRQLRHRDHRRGRNRDNRASGLVPHAHRVRGRPEVPASVHHRRQLLTSRDRYRKVQRLRPGSSQLQRRSGGHTSLPLPLPRTGQHRRRGRP